MRFGGNIPVSASLSPLASGGKSISVHYESIFVDSLCTCGNVIVWHEGREEKKQASEEKTTFASAEFMGGQKEMKRIVVL